jgi:hypothetical protein
MPRKAGIGFVLKLAQMRRTRKKRKKPAKKKQKISRKKNIS